MAGFRALPEAADERVRATLTRRKLLGSAVALSALGGFAARSGIPGAGAAQTDGSASPPATSPAASPVASPMASPSPTAPPQLLQIIHDQRPIYAGAPIEGGELRLLLRGGNNGNYNPAAARQDPQIIASYLDPLIWIDEVTMEPRPWLAESWRWTRDELRLTIELREGVLWHDGSPLTAADVVFSFFVYRDDWDSGVRNFFVTMDTAEARDDRTVIVRFNQPDGTWIFNACSQPVMQREQYVDYWESFPVGERTLNGFDWGESRPVGTGPWRLDGGDGSRLNFERNDDYWAGPPHFERLTLSVVEDYQARLDAWRGGSADLVWPVRYADVPALLPERGKLYVADAASVMFAAFNFDNPSRSNPRLLADISLRRALSLAIDRERYAREVFGGFIHEERGGTFAQPWANEPSVVNPSRDVDAARTLLADAGYRDDNGDGILESPDGDALHFTLIVRNTVRDELHALLDSIVPDLAEIGVGLSVRRLDAPQFEAIWFDSHNFDLVAYAYNLYPGFTDFDLYGSDWDIRRNIQGWNPGGYANQEADDLIRRALTETDPVRHAELLRALQRVTNEDLFGLWFGFPRDLVLARPDIQGFQPNKLLQTRDTKKLWRTPTT